MDEDENGNVVTSVNNKFGEDGSSGACFVV
jgi:hypothetical protein